MRAVRCHEFSAVEAVPVREATSLSSRPERQQRDVRGRQQRSKQKVNYRPRASPKRLRDVLKLDNIPIPRLRPQQERDHVLIRVYYAGIQYPDALQAQGLYQIRPPLPYIPGMDVTGVIVQIFKRSDDDDDEDGDDDDMNNPPRRHLKVGTRVMATLWEHGGTGGLAEYFAVPIARVYPLPDTVPMSSAANIGRNYFAAYHSLCTIGRIDAATTSTTTTTTRSTRNPSVPPLVLVDGASGGVGMAAVELAKAMHCRVIAAVSTPDRAVHPSGVGADAVLCYGRTRNDRVRFKRDVREMAVRLGHPNGIDLIIDVVQGDLFETALLPNLRPMGTICLVGFTAGQKSIRPGLVLVKEANIVGSIWGRWAVEHPRRHAENVQRILQFLATGAIRPRVNRIFDVSNFIEAFELFETNQGRGNTVLCFEREGEEGNEIKQAKPLLSRL